MASAPGETRGPIALPAVFCRLRRVAGFVVIATLVGCTEVTVQSGNGQVRVERHFGIVAIELNPGTDAQLLRSTGFGLIQHGQGVTLGYQDTELAILGRDCRLVLWIENRQQLVDARELLGNRSDLCLVPQQHANGE